MKWNYFGDYGQEDLLINLPPIIYPIEDEKFIFFPQKTKVTHQAILNQTSMSINPIELWKTNNTSNRFLLKFPIDLRDKIERDSTTDLWILQM